MGDIDSSNFDPTKTPIAIAPQGYDNDLIDTPSQAWMPRLAIYTTLPVAVSFVLLRLCSCLRLRRRLALDDCEHSTELDYS